MSTPIDLTTLDDSVLDAMRVTILVEQERRQRVADLPEQLSDMARAAVAAGVPASEVLAAAARGTAAEQPAAPDEAAAPLEDAEAQP